jgi:carbon dioxide concentrating mechanism protein CcmN
VFLESLRSMYLPPLQAQHDSESYISGDVTIQTGAAIAPGVMLLAAPNCQIMIAAGSCIGMGVVIHASTGNVVVQEGANLGAGVLIVGHGTVGANACIGASCTIMEASVAPRTLVPPGSILGDRSRQVATVPSDTQTAVAARDEPDPWQTPEEPSTSVQRSDPAQQRIVEANTNGSAQRRTVYGQSYVNELLSTLLPHRQQPPSPPALP